MGFILDVEFSGLCHFLVHPDGRQIGVVMPDGRLPKETGRTIPPYDKPPFKDDLVCHVGYLRYNLADTGVDVGGSGSSDDPSFEVVHRFDFDDLDFGLGFDEPLAEPRLAVPDVKDFAPNVEPVPGLFGVSPPRRLLMRTILRGGRLTSTPTDALWKFNGCLHPKGVEHIGKFAGFVRWRRFVFDDELVMRLSSWTGVDKTVVRLRPHGPERVVKLKIANLCAENPLEWPELFPRLFQAKADNDFKWFYFLWADKSGKEFKEILKGCKPGPLPVPEPFKSHGDIDNCTSSKQTFDFFQDA
jgi:hypothetical protein